MDGTELRDVVLQIIEDLSKEYTYLQSGAVLQRAQKRLGITKLEDEQALLAFFHDLFRIGYLSWGYNCLIRLRHISMSPTSVVRPSRSSVEIQPIRMATFLIYALSPVFCRLPNRT